MIFIFQGVASDLYLFRFVFFALYFSICNFSSCIFRVVFILVVFPMCIFRFESSDLHFHALYFPVCNFRFSFSIYTFIISILRGVFPIRNFRVVPILISRLLSSNFYYQVRTFRFVFFDLYLPTCISRTVFSDLYV